MRFFVSHPIMVAAWEEDLKELICPVTLGQWINMLGFFKAFLLSTWHQSAEVTNPLTEKTTAIRQVV